MSTEYFGPRSASYYDFEKFKSVAKNNNKHFSILSSNIQSINAKFSELEAFVNALSSLNFKFSIISDSSEYEMLLINRNK